MTEQKTESEQGQKPKGVEKEHAVDGATKPPQRETVPASWVAFLVHLLAALSTGAAFVLPFVSSDFQVSIDGNLAKASQAAFAPCERLQEAVGIPLPESVCASLQKMTTSTAGATLDATLGPVDDKSGLGWADCVAAKVEPAGKMTQSPIQEASEAKVGACAKRWIVEKAGIPVGTRYLHTILAELWLQKEMLLFGLVLLFSLVLPLSKIGFGMIFCLRPASGWFGRSTFATLKAISRFSMTDVFVVALLIVFFQAKSFNFRFHAEPGVYAFAVGALLSSLGLWMLDRRHRREKKS